ncbi:aromatic amino acid transaminase [Marinobacterium sediminicola]|uniref:Aspartate aminotransferase n=1 Tax=Marinobacterium sediminicola TaxID=518898 RepID=A0ABY1RYT5_9GAMM|nr:amino acid aminotransferase [Marinobacterium sediminicola]ULG68019.1 aspartate/tyrosine/aromatic aminotransferase [Marinobacterium sediminicola]SMR73471.1 aspartate aminotransferase [Marinobacterium sediminicola]
MFEQLKTLPQDPILGLMKLFREDPRTDKVDLGVGVYRDEAGQTPIMAAVQAAQQRLLETETTKAYIGPAGAEGFNRLMAQLLLGAEHPVLKDGRVNVVQTPGGCGALRMAAEFLKLCKPDTTVWVSTPTWANHIPLLGGAGLTIREYPYLDKATLSVDFDAMISCLEQAEAGDVVLLHGCCHNPSGADLDADQWSAITDLVERKGLLPFIDIAYQGLGEGLEQDAHGVRLMAERLPEVIVASSCSKNFGLYRERTGALMLIAANAQQGQAATSQLLSAIRSHYSMPPSHGAAVVEMILDTPELMQQWQHELGAMCSRILELRAALSQSLAPAGDFSFIERQRGMFSFLGISPQQVQILRDEFGIYMLDSSRINIAGLSAATLPQVANALQDVLGRTE